MARGRLVVLEGAEGVGKSTQLAALADWLRERGHPVVVVREPGGTPLGEAIRALLLDPAGHVEPRAEALLFMASRAQLVATVILPALERGETVLADRFFLSTYAYQIGARGLPEEEVREANALATGGLVPDLTVLLTLPPGEGLARARERGAADRMEEAGSPFHERVERAFASFADAAWQRAHPECGPVVTVRGTGSVEEVRARIVRELEARWPETFAAGVESHT
ncbi:MAG TPA: dTMP kinase [Gemmatimonadaceae bacterium]|nr:dTMP kinase [Gemmatimonadaceae bacterium]